MEPWSAVRLRAWLLVTITEAFGMISSICSRRDLMKVGLTCTAAAASWAWHSPLASAAGRTVNLADIGVGDPDENDGRGGYGGIGSLSGSGFLWRPDP